MKYRTVIELVCDATDREDAINISGEYLRGEVDFGVEMKWASTSVLTHKMKKYAITCLVALFALSAVVLKVTSIEGGSGSGSVACGNLSQTYTIMPELKTSTKEGFREEWLKKKDEAILDFLKK